MNSFAGQPLQLRLEALMSAALLTDTNAVLLADIAKANAEPWKRTSAEGVGFALDPSANGNDPCGWLAATNAGKVAEGGVGAIGETVRATTELEGVQHQKIQKRT